MPIREDYQGFAENINPLEIYDRVMKDSIINIYNKGTDDLLDKYIVVSAGNWVLDEGDSKEKKICYTK